MQDRRSESSFALIVALLRESGTWAGRTLALARAEIDGNIRALIGLSAMLGTLVVLVVAAFFVFLDAVVKALAVLTGSEILAAAVVAGPFVIAAGLLIALGLRRIARATAFAMPRARAGTAGGTTGGGVSIVDTV